MLLDVVSQPVHFSLEPDRALLFLAIGIVLVAALPWLLRR